MVTLTVSGPAGTTVASTPSVAIAQQGDGVYTASLPNSTASYTFTASFPGDAATDAASAAVTVEVSRYTGGGGSSRPSDGGSSRPGGGENTRPGSTATVIEDPEVPLAQPFPFVDVREDDWCFEGVKYAFDKGMMNGITDTLFAPEDPTTRGMIVTILYRLENSPAVTASAPYRDVPEGRYYTDAVAWADAHAIVNGYEDGTFRPDAPITREQMAAILYRYAGFKGYDVAKTADLSGYADAEQLSGYAARPMQWAGAMALINGSGNRLNPGAAAARSQIAVILMRFCVNVAQ